MKKDQSKAGVSEEEITCSSDSSKIKKMSKEFLENYNKQINNKSTQPRDVKNIKPEDKYDFRIKNREEAYDIFSDYMKKFKLPQGKVKSDLLYESSVDYMYGQSVEKNLAESFRLCKKSEEKARLTMNTKIEKSMRMYYDFACYKLFWHYYYGKGTNQNKKKALHWLKEAAKYHNMLAQYKLSTFYLHGKELSANHKKAYYWCRRSARGHSLINLNLYVGSIVVERKIVDYRDRLYVAAIAAFKDSRREAVYRLGLYYLEGVGCKKDRELAESCLRFAAELEHNVAWYQLSILHLGEMSNFSTKNIEKLKMLYAIVDSLIHSASSGYSKAFYQLGLLHSEGKYEFLYDQEMAINYFKMAYQLGYLDAKEKLEELNVNTNEIIHCTSVSDINNEIDATNDDGESQPLRVENKTDTLQSISSTKTIEIMLFLQSSTSFPPSSIATNKSKIHTDNKILSKALNSARPFEFIEYTNIKQFKSLLNKIRGNYINGVVNKNKYHGGDGFQNKSQRSTTIVNFINALKTNSVVTIIDLRMNKYLPNREIVGLIKVISENKSLLLECLCLRCQLSIEVVKALIILLENKLTLRVLSLGNCKLETASLEQRDTLKLLTLAAYGSHLKYFNLPNSALNYFINNFDPENTHLLEFCVLSKRFNKLQPDQKVEIHHKLPIILRRNRAIDSVRSAIEALHAGKPLKHNRLDFSNQIIKSSDFNYLVQLLSRSKNCDIQQLILNNSLQDFSFDAEVTYLDGLANLLSKKFKFKKLDISGNYIVNEPAILMLASIIAQNNSLTSLTLKNLIWSSDKLIKFVNIISSNKFLLDIKLSVAGGYKLDKAITVSIKDTVMRNKKNKVSSETVAASKKKIKNKVNKYIDDYLQQMVDLGDVNSKYILALRHVRSNNSKKYHKKAFRLLLDAAKENHPQSQYALGMMYQRGCGCKVNQKLGIQWLQKAGNASYALAYYQLGLIYATNKKTKLAKESFNKAYLFQLVLAKLTFRLLVKDSQILVKEIRAETKDVSNTNSSAKTKNYEREYNLGMKILKAKSSKGNRESAILHFQRAALFGHKKAYYTLANLYLDNNDNVYHNFKLATRYLVFASESGNAKAFYQLGMLHLANDLLSFRSEYIAKKYLAVASELGYTAAGKQINKLISSSTLELAADKDTMMAKSVRPSSGLS